MIAAKDAVAIFSKKHSDLTILNIIDYDDKWYIITAVDNPKVVSYSDPYFAVSKQNGSVKGFFPSAEIQKFFKAFRERSLDLKTFKPKSQAGELKHAADTFDQLTDDFLIHYGTTGMHWRQQGPGKRWQSQAVYAQGRPNPDAKVRGQKGLNDKPMDVNTINKQIASGELKSVGATNAKRWETSVKNAYKAAKNKPEDKLTKSVDRVSNEVSRLQKQASNNVNKEIRSQGAYSVGTLVVGNLFDRFSPERKTASSYRSYTYRYANGKVKFYEGGTDKEVKNESVFDDIDPRSVYIKKKWN